MNLFAIASVYRKKLLHQRPLILVYDLRPLSVRGKMRALDNSGPVFSRPALDRIGKIGEVQTKSSFP